MAVTGKRNINLDILRVIAALMVFMVHVGQNFGTKFTDVGAKGVQCFFILSGYLIFLSLEQKKSLADYYKKRFIHIVPVYYIVLVLLYVFDLLYYHFFKGFSFSELLSAEGACGIKYLRYFVFGQVMVPSNDWSLWNNRYALWTMSSFAVFYVIAPWIKKLIKNFVSASVILCILIGLREPLANLIEQLCFGRYSSEAHIEWFKYMNPINEIYCFVFGIVAYYAIKNGKQYLYAIVLAIVAVMTQFSFYEFEIIFTLLLICAVELPRLNVGEKFEKIIVTAGEASFALYLCHPVILGSVVTLCNMLRVNVYIKLCLAILVPVACSYIFWRFIQRPIEERLRVRLLKNS